MGAADRPEIYTNPFHSLNFNTTLKLREKRKFVLDLKIENLLNQNIELVYKSYQAADQYFEYRSPGILSRIKLTYNF